MKSLFEEFNKVIIIIIFIFVSSVLQTPRHFAHKVNKLIFHFIWNYKPPKICGTSLIKNKNEGGLGMKDLSFFFNKALKFTWVKHLYNSSMGVNFPDVIHWGPIRNMLNYRQESGRGGRGGEQTQILPIYYGQQVSFCKQDVKSFLQTDGCYRTEAYKPFYKKNTAT